VRPADILGLALAALWQQKVRTLLTTLGVVFGSFVLAASLSIDHGVQETIDREARRTEFLRRIEVWPERHPTTADPTPEQIPVPGVMSEAKRQRIRQALIEYRQRFSADAPRVAMSRDKLKALERLDHVEAVVPYIYLRGFAVLDGVPVPADKQAPLADAVAARHDNADGLKRLLAGRFFTSPNERAVVVSEFLLYRLGLINDADVPRVLGKKLRLEFRVESEKSPLGLYLRKPAGEEQSREETAALDKIRNQLPAALDKFDLTPEEKDALRKAVQDRPAQPPVLHGEEFTVVGVIRLPIPEERKDRYDPLRIDGDVVVPLGLATALYFQMPGLERRGVDQAVVLVDREENVKEVAGQIKALGLNHHTALEYIERERFMYLMIFGAMTCVAAVALLVAALGIANTMLMSVLERTREVGIMKAVGAANSHILGIFLIEGALIGLIGGGLGLALAWAASFPADAWVRSMVERDLKVELKESLFVFPAWLSLTVVVFAVLVTTLAAVYPARRAARVDPVTALRHE
jgi:putative ABC transport system permease protein